MVVRLRLGAGWKEESNGRRPGRSATMFLGSIYMTDHCAGSEWDVLYEKASTYSRPVHFGGNFCPGLKWAKSLVSKGVPQNRYPV